MSQSQLEFVLPDAIATEALGAALARACGALTGTDGAVIYLRGELGAGKTTCARSLLRTLGVAGLIRSPTYTLVELYQAGGITCVHVDLYRLTGPEAVEELGLRDYLGTVGLLLVEWPERGGGALPPPDLELTLNYQDDSRRAWLADRTERGRHWAAKLLHDTKLAAYLSN